MAFRIRLGAFMLSLPLWSAVACTPNPERLPTPSRNFYYVIEDDQSQLDYLRLKESEREPFLEKVGLWAKWLELSGEEREAVDSGEVEVGYKVFAAYMAWGLPADTRVVEARGRSVSYETFIRCTSGPKKGRYVRQNIDCDGSSSEVQLAIENAIVTEIKYLD